MQQRSFSGALVAVLAALAWLISVDDAPGREKGRHYVQTTGGERPAHSVAVDNVCAWPNLTVLQDGTIVATIHNQPSHLRQPGDIECWTSEDGGETWTKRGTPAPRGDEKAARGHVAAGMASNGDLLVITTGWSDPASASRGEITRTWVSRSSDGGKTWTIDKKTFPQGPDEGSVIPFGDIMRGSDGNLRVAMYRSHRTYIYCSRDDGRTWGEPATLTTEKESNETALFHLGGGKWLAAARSNGLDLYASDDEARTWIHRDRVAGDQQHPGHIARLEDGLLLTYGNRTNPRGVDVRFSDDEGQTWSEPRRIVDFEGDGGYPSSVRLTDGRVLSAYYARRIAGHDGYHMGVAVWDPRTTWGR